MTGIIIQARMGSTRLPGKIMKDLAGKPVLLHVLERCKRSVLADAVIVATSDQREDDSVADFCREHHAMAFRGSLNNVLERYYDCAKEHGLDTIVRITSDCPLIDPLIIDESIKLFSNSDVDYVSNCLHRVFPRGLDCEVFSFAALERAYHNAHSDHEKEHVTPYITEHGRTLPYKVSKAYEGAFRLTLDEADDYRLLRVLYEKFYTGAAIVDVEQVIQYLKKNPEVAKINEAVQQKVSH